MSGADRSARRGNIGGGHAHGEPKGSGHVLDDLERLRRGFESLQQQFAGGSGAKPQVGTDGTGAVRVTIDGDGRVTSVEIGRSWRDSVGYNLGAAVLEALSDAGTRQVAAWGEAVAREHEPQRTPSESHTGRGRLPAEGVAQPAGHTDSTEARRTLAELLSLLEGVESELDNLERRLDEKMRNQVSGRSPNNMVVVTMAGPGQVTDIDINRRFLDQANDWRITQELLGAFKAAYERAQKLDLDELLGDGQLGELYRLGSDPATLLRRLGLSPR